MVGGSLGDTVPLQGVHKLQTIFKLRLQRYLHFHCVNICTDDFNAKVGKSLGSSAPVRVVPANRPAAAALFTAMHKQVKKSQLHLRISLIKERKQFLLFKSWPWSASRLNALCDESQVWLKYFGCRRGSGIISRKSAVWLSELRAELAAFFSIFYPKEPLWTMVIQTWVLTAHKWSEPVTSRERLTVLVANDKIWTLKQKLEL